jgi:leader peptidase (prepilin peptidase)/N-methyltransferase
MALAYPGNAFLYNMRRLCLISVLLPAALIDWRTYRIPNSFIVAGVVYWAALHTARAFMSGVASAAGEAAADVVTAGALTAAAFLCAVAIRGSIGAGDIKMFAVMGLLLSSDGVWGAVFISLAVMFVVSVCLLLSRRKTGKDALPFAPALAVGTLLSVILSGT